MGLSLSCIRGNSKNEPIEPLRIVPEAQEVPAQVEITELCDLTEKLIEKDENNCAKYIKYNVQNRRNGNKDTCKYPLFSKVDDNMYQLPTVKAFIALTDNFNPVSTYYLSLKILQVNCNFPYFYRMSPKKKMLLLRKNRKKLILLMQ